MFIPAVVVLWFKFVTKPMVITNQCFSFAFFVFMIAFFVFTQYQSPVCFLLYSHKIVDALNQRGDTTREMTQTNQRTILHAAVSCLAIKWREQNLGKSHRFLGNWQDIGLPIGGDKQLPLHDFFCFLFSTPSFIKSHEILHFQSSFSSSLFCQGLERSLSPELLSCQWGLTHNSITALREHSHVSIHYQGSTYGVYVKSMK